jgi:hypothetical protein
LSGKIFVAFASLVLPTIEDMDTIQENDKAMHTNETKAYNDGKPFVVEQVDLVKELVRPKDSEEWIPLKELVLEKKEEDTKDSN